MSNNPRLNKQINAFQNHETGTHYNINRDYNPVTGRYIQSDPIGFDGGVNGFGYVNGQPISARDPLGLWCIFGFGNTCGVTPTTPPITLNTIISNGSYKATYTFDSVKRIKVEAWSTTVWYDAFYYTVDYEWLDSNGNPIGWVRNPGETTHGKISVYVGYSTHAYRAFQAAELPYYATGYRWFITIPPQQSNNSNMGYWYLKSTSYPL